MASIQFYAHGTPVPKGSAKAFLSPKARKVIVMQDNAEKQKPWASTLGLAAAQCMTGKQLFEGPVSLEARFYFLKPSSAKRLYPSVRPDLDKLLRCLKDALTGVCWKDDGQVVRVVTTKEYSDRPGVNVCVREIEVVK